MELSPYFGCKYEAPALAVETWIAFSELPDYARRKYEAPALAVETPLRWSAAGATRVASTKPLRWPLKRRCDTAMFRKSILPELREHGTDILDATVKRPSATLRELMPFRPTLGVRAQPRLNAP